jgi:hypothetical protein
MASFIQAYKGFQSKLLGMTGHVGLFNWLDLVAKLDAAKHVAFVGKGYARLPCLVWSAS